MLGLLVFVGIIFWLWAVFDAATSDARQVRALPKLVWLLVIVVFQAFGGIAWVLLGRPVGARRGSDPGDFGPRSGGPRVPVGPDDDPDFLRGI